MANTSEGRMRRWFEEVWNQRREETIDEMLHPEVTTHGLGPRSLGPEPFKRFYADFLRAFPDIHIEVEDVLVHGDMEVVRFTARATHQGDYLGIPASGQPVEIKCMGWAREKDGRTYEAWNCVDFLPVLIAAGVVKP